MPRDDGMGWFGGNRPEGPAGGRVDAIAINVGPPPLAVDPDAAVEAPRRAGAEAGPSVFVEPVDRRPRDPSRPGGRMKLPR